MNKHSLKNTCIGVVIGAVIAYSSSAFAANEMVQAY